ncbi:MAG: hypothetical protein ABI921_09700 [Panacibacter sp.]
MKKLISMVFVTISLLAVSQTMAQKESVTAATATKENGYTVLNQGEPITIYKYQHAAHSPKEAEKYAPKYYFTTNASAALQELTKMNLKKAFPKDHPFHDALDAQFKEDKELINYDSFHKMYKLNHIYISTVKQ